MRLTQTVIAFWDEVWNAHNPDAADRFVEDDIMVEISGRKVFGKDKFKDWIRDFLEGGQRTARRRHRDISERGRDPSYGQVVPNRDEQRHLRRDSRPAPRRDDGYLDLASGRGRKAGARLDRAGFA